MVENLTAVKADQGDFCGTGEVQVVSGDRVGFLAVRGELAGPDQCLLPHQRRDRDEREVPGVEQVQGVGEHRALEQDHLCGQRVGAFPRDLAGPREVGPAALLAQLHMVQRLEAELRWRTNAPDDHVRGLVGSDRSAFPWDHGRQQQQALQPFCRLGQLLAERSELDLELFVLGSQLGPAGVVGLGEFLRGALPAGLGLVQFVLKLAAGVVEVDQFVHVQVNPLDPDSLLHRIRVVPDLSPVQHDCAKPSFVFSVACPPPRKTLPAVLAAPPHIIPWVR